MEQKRERMEGFGREEEERLIEKMVKGRREFGLRWRSFIATIFKWSKAFQLLLFTSHQRDFS